VATRCGRGKGGPDTAMQGRTRERQGKREREGEGRERGIPTSEGDSGWGPANRGKEEGDRWGQLQC
jgi:hypothetical protein